MKEIANSTGIIFSVVLPCYNEGAHLLALLQRLQLFFEAQKLKTELICIDDASSDETLAILENFQKGHPLCQVLHFEKNQGQGAAFREALKLAQGQYIFWLPSDGEISPLALEPLLKNVAPNQVVLNYPVDGFKKRALHRYLLSKMYQALLRFLFGMKLKYFNATAIYPKSAIENLQFYSNRFFFPAELLIRTHLKTKLYFYEVPFKLEPRQSGKSTALRFSVLKDILINLSRLLFEKWKEI